MKWWQNHFDVITIVITGRQDYGKEKGGGGGGGGGGGDSPRNIVRYTLHD